MKKIKITTEQAKVIKQMLVENEESGLKSASFNMGNIYLRIVISGENVGRFKDRLLGIVRKHDNTSDSQYYEATNKIVGKINQLKLPSIKRDIRALDPTIAMEDKPIVNTIKKEAVQESINVAMANSKSSQSKAHNRVDTGFNKEMASNGVTLPENEGNLSTPLPKKVMNKFNPTDYQQFNEAIKGLIRGMYSPEQMTEENGPDYWSENGSSKDELMEYLNKLGLVTTNENGVSQLAKKTNYTTFNSPTETMLALETSIKSFLGNKKAIGEILQNESGYPAGAQHDSRAPYNEPLQQNRTSSPKAFEAIAMNNEVVILKSANNKLFVFYYYDLDLNNRDVSLESLTDYVNDNLNSLSSGSGLSDFEGNVNIVEIDKDLKNELIKHYDKSHDLITSLNSIDEASYPELFKGLVNVDTQKNSESPEEKNARIKAKLNTIKTSSPSSEPIAMSKEPRKLYNTDLEETTVAGSAATGGSSGPFVGPMNTPIVKKSDDSIYETTDSSGGVGAYDANALSGIGRNGEFKSVKKSKAETTPQWSGGSFVKQPDCAKLNNNKSAQDGGCNSGASSLKTVKTSGSINAPSLSENEILEVISKKTGLSIDGVKKIIESRLNTK